MLQQALRRAQEEAATADAAAAAAKCADTAAFLAARTAGKPVGEAHCITNYMAESSSASGFMAGLPNRQSQSLMQCPHLHPTAAVDQAPTWGQLRSLGAGFWLRDFRLLATLAERLAKQQFAARRNADDCALLYCALGKRSVLQVSMGTRSIWGCLAMLMPPKMVGQLSECARHCHPLPSAHSPELPVRQCCRVCTAARRTASWLSFCLGTLSRRCTGRRHRWGAWDDLWCQSCIEWLEVDWHKGECKPACKPDTLRPFVIAHRLHGCRRMRLCCWASTGTSWRPPSSF